VGLLAAHEVGELPPIAVFWGDRDKIVPIAHGKAFAKFVDGVVFVSRRGCEQRSRRVRRVRNDNA
jgi:hypothetical protein